MPHVAFGFKRHLERRFNLRLHCGGGIDKCGSNFILISGKCYAKFEDTCTIFNYIFIRMAVLTDTSEFSGD